MSDRYEGADAERAAAIAVATDRLAGAAGVEAAATVLVEILANLVGSEQYRLYRVRPGAGPLSLVPLTPGAADPEPALVQVVERREARFATDGTSPVAVVPLLAGPTPVGLLVVDALLPQKERLTPDDTALLRLLGRLAGEAMRWPATAAEGRA